MNLTEILYVDEALTKVDQDIIVDCFNSSTIKKYLRIIARNDLIELAQLSLQNLTAEELSKKHALVQGKLSAIVSLLSISKQEN